MRFVRTNVCHASCCFVPVKACQGWAGDTSVGASDGTMDGGTGGIKDKEGRREARTYREPVSIPEEWMVAAEAAGCSSVEEMLVEFASRIAALEEVTTELRYHRHG